MPSAESITSPRLAALYRELESGSTNALEIFWQEIAEQGVPLIEQIEDDPDDELVTFLWRSCKEMRNVVVVSAFGGYKLADNQMTRLPDTDIWYRTYKLRSDLRTTYRLAPNDSLVPLGESKDWREREANWQPDPLNPRTHVIPKDEKDPEDTETTLSVLELSKAPPQLWVEVRPDVPTGQLEMFRLRSDVLDNDRCIWVYTPPGYTAYDEPYDLLILFDGLAYTQVVPTPTILDNLLSEGLIAPTVAVFPDNPETTRKKELPCYPPFADFLSQELIPWIHQRYNVSSDPAYVTIGGSSHGGLAAVFAGLKHPELFGNILSQSGSFWWKPKDATEYEWLTRQFAWTDRLPLWFYLDVGLLESIAFPGHGCPSPLVANRHMRNILQAKGYTLHYAEYNGGHDYICWQGTLADGLLALVGIDTDKKVKERNKVQPRKSCWIACSARYIGRYQK
jgi:enterochelin esterase family protein